MSNETAIESLQEKIDDLNQQAWDVRITDLPKAFELSQESVKLARSIDYPKGLAEGLRSLGFSYVRFYKNEEATPLLKESLSLFQSLNDLKGQAVIYEYLGIIERNWGNLGASLGFLLKAYELVLQTGPLEVEITCSYQLGVTYKHLGNHENALDYLYKTLSLAKKIKNPLMEAYATNIIGSIYFDNGNYNEALDCYQQGLPIRRQSHDKWGEAGSLDNIGFTYLKLNDLDKAIEYCKQSLTICQATDDKRGEANALLHLGEIYQQAGDIKQAADFSNQSLEIRKERGDKRGETEVLLFLADLYKNRSDVKDHQIFEWLSGALKIADEIKSQDLLSKTYYNLHEYYQRKGNFKESIVQLEAHFQIEKELHKNSINQKIANLEISHKAEAVSQRNKELTVLNERIEKANEGLKIEAALEKIRSRSLAMHKSDELREVVAVVFEKLQELNFSIDGAAFIMTYTESSKVLNVWIGDDKGQSYPTSFRWPFNEAAPVKDFWVAIESGMDFFSKTYSFEEKNQWFRYAFEHTDFKNLATELKNWIFKQEYLTQAAALAKNSIIGIHFHHQKTLSETEVDILKKFSKVFDQAYIRFRDLQKAELQARESQIQLALERVRARTMAMQKSEELREAVLVIYEQLQQLDFNSKACNIIILDKETNNAQYWVSGFSQELYPESYNVPYLNHPYQDALIKPWKRGDKYAVYEYTGQMKQSFDDIFFTQTEFRNVPEEAKNVMIGLKAVILSTAFISYGALQSLGAEPLSEENANILQRFAKVFEQTYTRFLDLQKAEAQAREAQIETALERVRSRTMGMQKSEELKDVIQVVFEQFVQLNIKIEHTGFVMDYKTRDDYNIWIADPLGVPSQVTIPYFDSVYYNRFNEAKKNGEDFFATNLSFEEKNKFYQKLFEYVPGLPEEAKKFYFSCPGLAASTVLLDNVCLYIENFSGTPYTDEENKTLMRFGKVFQQTYTRFNDLKLAEAHALQAEEDLIKLQREKKRAEDALSELQVTQKQLIHSEKMASLGELTAGIAHEIQNPLNFVNNFSDVNKELLVEMKEEIEKGNTEEVVAIANDIISNEEKINHHGKRADAIVKGMLQHSRSSSGVKELTDINELADEFLRLAYHGLRAKDKSFNATMKTYFDEAVGKINVIPQDIGRVFLNLITNAFYVVAEKKKQLANGYEPTVTVTTKKESDKVVVSIKDNGSGIPQKVLDKIFQPFFTTKPTGQGTGLGLSLSYDIVKAHSGEIKVKTKEGEGSEFVILLPVV